MARPQAQPGQVLTRATYGLFFLQCLLFLVLVVGEGAEWQVRAVDALTVFGAGSVAERPWVLLTFSFVNLNPFVLVASSAILWLVGVPVEEALGRGRMVLLYLVAGASCALVHVVLYELDLVAGPAFQGSLGPTAGLLTAYLLLQGHQRRIGSVPFPVVYLLAAASLALVVAFVARDDLEALGRDRQELLAQATGEQATEEDKAEAVLQLSALEDHQRDPYAHLFGLALGGLALLMTLAAARTSQRYRVMKEIRTLQEEVDARARVEELLEKISHGGMGSLTRNERRFLRYASRFYQARLSRSRG